MNRIRLFLRFSLLLQLFLSGVYTVFAATPNRIKEIAKDLVCLCGTCNRESLSTCLCNYGIAQRDKIGREIDLGKTANDIIQGFTVEFGDVVLASPRAEGINLLAWITPIAAVLIGGIILRLFVSRRVDSSAPYSKEVGKTTSSENPLDDRQQKRLQNELKQFEEGE